MDSSAGRDPVIDSLLTVYKQRTRQLLEDTLACTATPLTRSQPESTVGNLLTDALLAIAQEQDHKTVAAFLNYSAIALDYIPPGPLTRQVIYDLLPYNDAMIILELSGDDIRALCDTIAMHKGWPLSGIRFVIDSGKAMQISIGGNELQRNRLYKIACNDLLFRKYIGRQQGTAQTYKRSYCSLSVVMAVIRYIQEWKSRGECLHSVLDNRISYAE